MGKKVAVPKGTSGAKKQEEPCEVASLDSKAVGTKRRQLSRRDTDQQVERALKSAHFRHISEQSLHNKVVEGKDLRQSLKEIIHGLQKGQRIGALTYSALAAKYADNHCLIEALRSSSDDGDINSELVSILVALQHEHGLQRAQKSLELFLKNCDELPEKNIVGLVRTVFASKLQARPDAAIRTMAVMTYFSRFQGLVPRYLKKQSLYLVWGWVAQNFPFFFVFF